MPNGMKYEWTELTYQKILAGNTMVYIFPLSVFLVYSCLPPNTKLVVTSRNHPDCSMTLFSAIAGVWLLNGDNNVFNRSV